MAQERFPMTLLVVFAGLSLLLAAVGLYGLISYSVTQRVQEIGVRMALGADRGTIFRLLLGEQLRLVLIGVAAGTAGALILGRILTNLSHLLYGVGPGDPVTLVVSASLLIAVAILASYMPTRGAMNVDPMVALRHE